MHSTLEALLDEVAKIDPEKAAHLRWVGPHLKEEGTIAAARQFLAANAGVARARSAGPCSRWTWAWTPTSPPACSRLMKRAR